jgi:hypothetical protein
MTILCMDGRFFCGWMDVASLPCHRRRSSVQLSCASVCSIILCIYLGYGRDDEQSEEVEAPQSLDAARSEAGRAGRVVVKATEGLSVLGHARLLTECRPRTDHSQPNLTPDSLTVPMSCLRPLVAPHLVGEYAPSSLPLRWPEQATSRGCKHDESETKPRLNGESGALISAKDETIRVLHEHLEAEYEAHREARCIIAGLVQRIPELETPTESPEPRPSEARPGSSEDPAEAQEATEPRSWWRRLLEGG